MPNYQGTKKNLKPMNSPWVHRSTRTIRIPIIFADAALEYIHKLDRGELDRGEEKSNDTVVNLDTHNRIEELELENQALKAELDMKSKTDLQLPDAADLLNKLKAKNRKSKITLQDVQAILDLIEG